MTKEDKEFLKELKKREKEETKGASNMEETKAEKPKKEKMPSKRKMIYDTYRDCCDKIQELDDDIAREKAKDLKDQDSKLISNLQTARQKYSDDRVNLLHELDTWGWTRLLAPILGFFGLGSGIFQCLWTTRQIDTGYVNKNKTQTADIAKVNSKLFSDGMHTK